MTELPPPQGIEPKPTPFEEQRRQIIESKLPEEEERRQIIKLNQQELQRRIEAGELEGPFDFEDIYRLLGEKKLLTRGNIGNKAVVITQKQLKWLGYLDIVRPDGHIETIGTDTGYKGEDQHIYFPEDLGELPEEAGTP